MCDFALQVIRNPDGSWRWRLIEHDYADKYVLHSLGDRAFDSFQVALDTGTLALAIVMKQPYENKRAAPLGDAGASS